MEQIKQVFFVALFVAMCNVTMWGQISYSIEEDTTANTFRLVESQTNLDGSESVTKSAAMDREAFISYLNNTILTIHQQASRAKILSAELPIQASLLRVEADKFLETPSLEVLRERYIDMYKGDYLVKDGKGKPTTAEITGSGAFMYSESETPGAVYPLSQLEMVIADVFGEQVSFYSNNGKLWRGYKSDGNMVVMLKK